MSYLTCHAIDAIEHSHIVLIITDLNGLGHLPEFTDQIEPKNSNSSLVFGFESAGQILVDVGGQGSFALIPLMSF